MPIALRLVLPCLVLPVVALAQGKAPVAPGDYGKWETSTGGVLSPDGRWLAYTVSRVDETQEVRAHRLERDTLIALAQGSAPQFGASSRWLAYTVQPTPAEREKLERERKPVRSSAAVLDLSTGRSRVLAPASSHRLSADGRYLAVRLHPADAVRRDAGDLLVHDLDAGTVHVIGNVASYAWSDVGAQLAVALETDGNIGNGIQLLDARSGRLVTLASSSDRYRALAWRKRASDLVALRSQITAGFRDTTHAVMLWRDMGTAQQTSLTLDPVAAAGMPPGMRISDTRTPEWTPDGGGLVLGLRPWERDTRDTTRKTESPKLSDVQVWHASDVRPIPMQKVQDAADLRRTTLAVWWPASQRLVALNNDPLHQITLAEKGPWAVEVRTDRYPWGRMFGRLRTDVEAIDLRTGVRRRLADSVRHQGGLSPSGAWYAWYASGTWKVASTADGVVRTLGAAPAAFADSLYDSPTDELPPHGFGAWATDERSIYVYDRFDVWQLPLAGGTPIRLTNGTPQNMVYRLQRTGPFDGRGLTVDPTQPVMLSRIGEWSRETGYVRRNLNGQLQELVFASAGHQGLSKADSANVYAWTRQRFDEPANWYVTDGAFRTPTRVSDLNAFHANYAWGRAELMEFTSETGRRQQGVLYYPANYEPSRKYPMIVNTYEIMTPQIHQYVPPSERTYYNRTVWTAHGYFVFTPDVVFRGGDPGRSYMESLVPAVKAVIARGVVDSARIGLVGHSWGGYEAAYAPTQTNIFATSIAGAAITNLLSFPGAFHWSAGMPEFDHWETGQGRMARPPWEDLEGHLRNSPVNFIHKLERPMLLMFGDADGTVDWHQGVEFYNFARRAGKKDVVMLVYPGEDHGLRKKENQIDYQRRILQWFGHYLKGEPASEWITRGVTWQERKAVLDTGSKSPQ